MLKNIFRRLMSVALVVFSILNVFSISANAAEEPSAALAFGWGLPYSTLSIVDLKNQPTGGVIYAYEGFTITSAAKVGNVKLYGVVYSTPNGAKFGYVPQNFFGYYDTDHSSWGKVISTTATYYGTDTNKFQQSGTVYSGEIVCVLAMKNNWAYIEFDTNSGRKRGWCSKSNISVDTRYVTIKDTPNGLSYIGRAAIYSQNTVYAGPGDHYFRVGTIYNNESVFEICKMDLNTQSWMYITYSTANGTQKSGYVRIK